jgi:CRP-like cAMP-binding protein
VAALTDCELLELDRPTLDSITKTHPRVLDVLQEFAQQRTRKKS